MNLLPHFTRQLSLPTLWAKLSRRRGGVSFGLLHERDATIKRLRAARLPPDVEGAAGPRRAASTVHDADPVEAMFKALGDVVAVVVSSAL